MTKYLSRIQISTVVDLDIVRYWNGGDIVPLIMAIVSSVLNARNSNWQGGSPNLVDNVSTIIRNVGRTKSGSERTGGR